jgi:hypothetical protein
VKDFSRDLLGDVFYPGYGSSGKYSQQRELHLGGVGDVFSSSLIAEESCTDEGDKGIDVGIQP